jgi:hypothetical protein
MFIWRLWRNWQPRNVERVVPVKGVGVQVPSSAPFFVDVPGWWNADTPDSESGANKVAWGFESLSGYQSLRGKWWNLADTPDSKPGANKVA